MIVLEIWFFVNRVFVLAKSHLYFSRKSVIMLSTCENTETK